jgi:uncharacterized protein HemX
MQAVLIKWALGGLVLLGLVVTIYVQSQDVKIQKLKLATAESERDAYRDTLTAYQTQFQDQVDGLNAEKRSEIKRQEHLLKTLNLIGDLNDKDKQPVGGPDLSIIDSLYE